MSSKNSANPGEKQKKKDKRKKKAAMTSPPKKKPDNVNRIAERLHDELDALPFVDPHSHVDGRTPVATSPLSVLGYHYYTELVHSAGLQQAAIEEAGIEDSERFRRIFSGLPKLTNTVQYSWFVDIWRNDFEYEGPFSPDSWQDAYEAAQAKLSQPDWERQVIEAAGLEAVFMTNDFDDPLDGFDTEFYVPCFRTDQLVFHLADPDVRKRLAKASGVSVDSAKKLREAIAEQLKFFVMRGCRAAAISLPPDFEPKPVGLSEVDRDFEVLLRDGLEAEQAVKEKIARFAFWWIAELCAAQEKPLPFDLMIGVNRKVYPAGVYQGQDLFDSRMSLYAYRELFNSFPSVTFPVSVLPAHANHELVSYAWIFPNVVTNGHWWYSNTPSQIEQHAELRLEAVPRNKQIGYYSDAYVLEFVRPKVGMYKRILSDILARRFVLKNGWSEEDALALGKEVLVDNSRRIFRFE